jgi:D-3-phosphoglycerate dehydrogenase
MIQSENRWKNLFIENNMEYDIPEFEQTLSVDRLLNIIDKYDAWIIGDDNACHDVIYKGSQNKLRICVKWGVGVDNVDIEACKKYNILFTNTPNSFGEEVSDIAVGFLINLTRQLHTINNDVKNGIWTKIQGMSLSGKKGCIVGFGDIGRNLARKLLAFNIETYVSDPNFHVKNGNLYNTLTDEIITMNVKHGDLNYCMKNADFIFVCCSLNKHTYKLINRDVILLANKNCIIINVSRGDVVDEADVKELLNEGFIDCIGFDVFNQEPVSVDNELLKHKKSMFSSHNSSNTKEAVDTVNNKCINFILSNVN